VQHRLDDGARGGPFGAELDGCQQRLELEAIEFVQRTSNRDPDNCPGRQLG
jgi:hypothetical protein